MRLTAIGMLATVIPGIFGVFFFLGRNGVGAYIFSKVLVDGFLQIFQLNCQPYTAGFVLLHLFAIGYCFNNVCIYLENKLFIQKNNSKIKNK